MTFWISASLNNAAVVAVLGACAWCVARVVRRPEVVHVAWILVLAKLVAPPLIPLPVPMFWPDLERAAAGDWRALLLVVWVTGSVVVGGTFLLKGLAFHRLIQKRGVEIEAARIMAEELAGRLGLRRTPRVVLLDACTTPMVWGLGRFTTIVFPCGLWGTATPPARRAMLLHELAHVRRGDPAVRFLEATAMWLYWWHPVVWLASREIEAAEEQCCDASALEAFDGPPRAYAEALLDAIDFASGGVSRPLLGTGLCAKRDLTRRLTRIMLGGEALRLPLRIRAGLLLAALAALPLYPISQPVAVVNDPLIYADSGGPRR